MLTYYQLDFHKENTGITYKDIENISSLEIYFWKWCCEIMMLLCLK